MKLWDKLKEWFYKMDDVVQKRKAENHTRTNIMSRGKKGRVQVSKTQCPFCPSRKMFYKNGIYKCTKCGKFVRL